MTDNRDNVIEKVLFTKEGFNDQLTATSFKQENICKNQEL